MATPNRPTSLDQAMQRRGGAESSRAPALPPRTLILSDVRLFREGLALALGSRCELRLIGAAQSLPAALERLEADGPTVLLLDVGMPEVLQIARTVMRGVPGTKIVAIAVSDDSSDIVACAEAGMAGYVSRDGSIDDVVAAIHGAVRDEVRCAPHVAATLFRRLASLAPGVGDGPDHDPLLTPRELEIVALIDQGLSNKTIGGRLRIGTPTVKNHVHHILEKLKVRRRGEAAALVRTGHAGVRLARHPEDSRSMNP